MTNKMAATGRYLGIPLLLGKPLPPHSEALGIPLRDPEVEEISQTCCRPTPGSPEVTDPRIRLSRTRWVTIATK